MCVKPTIPSSTSVELADIFRQHGDSYCQTYVLTPEQYKVLHAIQNCRTSALGGHVQQCDACHTIQCHYNSCRNRHCPKCESFKAAQWLLDREAELLPVNYFHVVFTLPHELNTLVMYNKKTLYNSLFHAAWEALNTLGHDKKRLGGDMGMLSILHTWGQTLTQHNHVHCIVPGGALNPFTNEWKASKKYLFPVKVLSKLFRGAYVNQLRAAYDEKQLTLPPDYANTPIHFDQLLNTLMSKDWVVYAKPPFAGPKQLLNYLGRYTHKIAISNYRILDCNENAVTFTWRDYADDNKEKIMTLHPHEFIRRFLSHVLPEGFVRIRSFGFLANACKAKKVNIIQKQLNYQPKPKTVKPDTATLMLILTGVDITVCAFCKIGKLKSLGNIPNKLNNLIFDSS